MSLVYWQFRGRHRRLCVASTQHQVVQVYSQLFASRVKLGSQVYFCRNNDVGQFSTELNYHRFHETVKKELPIRRKLQ